MSEISKPTSNVSRYLPILIGSGVFIGLYIMKKKQESTKNQGSLENQDTPGVKSTKNKINPKQLKHSQMEKQQQFTLEQNIITQPIYSSNKKNIYKICLTGGPCSGKTSSLTFLSEKLRERGFNVFLVPVLFIFNDLLKEAATMIAAGGGMVNIENFGPDDSSETINSVFELFYGSLENTYENIATMSNNENSVVLCDRGLLDGKAYMSDDLWQQMLTQYNLDEATMLKRYNAVCHLVTAADGAAQFYNLNHEARHESPELAIAVDKRTQEVWTNHPNFVRIDNYSIQGFQQKLQTAFNSVSSIVGLPIQQVNQSMRFLLDTGLQMIPSIPNDIPQEIYDIVDVFPEAQILNSNQILFQKIQKRTYDTQKQTKDQTFVYVWVEKILEDGVRKTNTKRQITVREYRVLMDRQDKQRRAVEKRRICFMYDNVYMTIDTYPRIKEGFSILKFHPNDSQDLQKRPPPFLKIKRDVTYDPGYKTRQLAKTSWYVPEGDEKIINLRKLSNIDEDATLPNGKIDEDSSK